MKKSIRVITVAVLMLIMFTACGAKKYDTVEAYYMDHQTEYDEAEKLVQDQIGDDLKFEMIFKENTLTYQYTFVENVDKSAVTGAADSMFQQQEEQFKSVADQLKKESGVDECIVKVTMLNPNGDVLAEKDYTAE